MFSFASLLTFAVAASATPISRQHAVQETFDLQAHRGGRGETVESTIASFAWALVNGVKTLELDNGITKDGVVMVWHDENIEAAKCRDTKPVTPDDPDFPYVGKYIANLTLAQLKTLDCGSQRLNDFPEQLRYPGLKLSTMDELFDFVQCVDTENDLYFNIESKIDAALPHRTRPVADFVELQYEAFAKSQYLHHITYQSFDWRSLLAMKVMDSSIPTSALISPATANPIWMAGLNLLSYEGSLGERIAQAASDAGADVLSSSDISDLSLSADPNIPGFRYFTTKDMIDKSHELGLLVKPWTVNRMNIAEQLLDWGVDGIITDYPHALARTLTHADYFVNTGFPPEKVWQCFEKHAQFV
ncbi:PLC-like phosphodiesterase [Cylindrobasidium torrendii FP15055 ss-10]|uniref:PLC-like phosphodiesterase n=1 Tax=Cylindrobasidium torrendii FP15055 ss-10 TaxID=1314674 RepID=A0A0D7BAQ7_9AGAR|nr:PLC-like phosphodiesterase [Cylindrobasidium torrendii FP15055 ss-10]